MTRGALVSVALGVVGALIVVLAFAMEPTRTSYVWLATWIMAWITGVGALTVLCLAKLSNGDWIVPMRRPLEALASSLPLSSLALAPALALRFDAPVWGRAVPVLALPIVAVEWLTHLSRAQDRERVARTDDYRHASTFGLLVAFACTTIAAFDWVGGLHPRWISNALGLELLSGGVVTALGVIALVVTTRMLAAERDSARVEHLLTLSRALFVGACAWMYLSFAPFLVVWMGDLPAGVSWYGPRVTGAWWWLATTIVLARFVVPFVVLLTDPMRRRPAVVLVIASLLVITEPLVLAWLVLPSWSPGRVSLRWTDLGLLALVFSSTALVSWARARHASRLPMGDPALARAASYRAR